jgi:hypothetical protein
VSGRKAILLRIDPALSGELARWAAAELRSVNSHLEYLLRQAVANRHRDSAAETAQDHRKGKEK